MAAREGASVVEEVKVFLRGAEIRRRMTMTATEGKNTVLFEGLPQDVRPESVNASIEKGGTLISAEFTVDSFKTPMVSKELNELKKRYEDVKDSIREEESGLGLLASEEEFLILNGRIGGDSGSTLNDLKDAENYYRKRKEEIFSSRRAAGKRLEALKEELGRITKEMGSYPPEVVRHAGKITVEFHSEKECEAVITVSYYLNSARWVPFYEVRVSETDSVSLSMKGNIFQNTGEDWNDVKVKLSTGNPTLGNNHPVMRPWYIDMVMPQARRPLNRERCSEKVMCDELCDEEVMALSCSADMETVRVAESNTAVEFILPAVLNIQSSNRPSKVEISKHVMDAEIYYYCASKLDTDAFLLAKITGWESLNLLNGEASIFNGNDYAGKTNVDPSLADDGMEISLGRDKGMIVTREKGGDMTSKSMMGSTKRSMREWNITVRNTKSKAVKMRLIDQLPISTNSAISVNPVELSGAEHDKETGILTWSLEIPAGGSVKKTMRYEVSYPKNGTIHLD